MDTNSRIQEFLNKLQVNLILFNYSIEVCDDDGFTYIDFDYDEKVCFTVYIHREYNSYHVSDLYIAYFDNNFIGIVQTLANEFSIINELLPMYFDKELRD